MRYVFFKASTKSIIEKKDKQTLPPGYEFEIWRPSLTRVYPAKFPSVYSKRSLLSWWILSYLLKPNGMYRILLVYKDGVVVHYTLLLPRNPRCPFMGKNDAKLGHSWTHESHRGKGIAGFAVDSLVTSLADRSSIDFWWFCNEENTSSMRVAQKLGFECVGFGILRPRIGLDILRAYVITDYKLNENTRREA